MKFIDEAKVFVKSGHGGPGAISFRREAMTPRGGPDGGDGGRGGDVIVRVDRQLGTLLDFKFTRKFIAADGDQGQGSNSSGRAGPDAILKVPPGTLVKTVDGKIIADLTGELTEIT